MATETTTQTTTMYAVHLPDRKDGTRRWAVYSRDFPCGWLWAEGRSYAMRFATRAMAEAFRRLIADCWGEALVAEVEPSMYPEIKVVSDPDDAALKPW